MSEIINVHIGGCGVNVGLKYWQQLAKDKQDNKDDNNIRYDRLYYQGKDDKSKQVPRAIFVDSDIRSNYKVSCNKIEFDTSNVIGYGTSCSIFPQGKYSQQGKELMEMFQQSLRSEVQKCDCLSGFIVTRSPTGGCGSGVGSNIISYLNDKYADTVIQQFKIIPGLDQKFNYTNLTPLQVYNTVLTNFVSVMDTRMIYTIENNAVQNILERRGIKNCGFNDVNQYIGRCMVEHVSAYIEPGCLNTSQRKRIVNLVPFYRMKHMAVGLSEQNVRNSLRSALDIDNRLCRYNERVDKRIFTMSVNIRESQSSENQTHKKLNNWLQNTSNMPVDWLPNNYHISFSKTSTPVKQRAWIIINSLKNIDWVSKISQQYTKLMQKKPFIQHYQSKGMQEMDFMEAKENLSDLISDYIAYESYCHVDYGENF